MPELPDVEAFRRHLDATGLHREIGRVRVHDSAAVRAPGPQRFRRALAGRSLQRTHRHGKHLFAAVSGGAWVVMHFGMTGRLEHDDGNGRPPRHIRVTLDFGDGSRLAYVDQRRLGFVALTHDVDDFTAAERLGPDALDLSVAGLRDLLRSRRGSVKSALMNQAVVAGIGNIYSDEICFHARLDPRTTASSLDDTAVRRLHRQVGRVLRMAADRGADPTRVPRGWLLPYREEGAPCPRGNGEVRKLSMSGRGAFYCPACQPS